MIDKVVNFEHDILIPKCDVYIKNVIQSAWLLAKRNQSEITEKEIIQGIRRELIKDGKSIDSI